MEIERKFLIKELPENYDTYPHHKIEQGYLCQEPVVRIRRQDDEYILTYKSKGLLVREEQNLPLTKDAYDHLKNKIDGVFIKKIRYKLPFQKYVIELDIFEGDLAPLIMAEVEFTSVAEANAFTPPDWFSEDVTMSPEYHNNEMAMKKRG